MWVNIDYDFGLRYMTLVVALRRLTVDGIHFSTSREPAEIQALANQLQAYVARHRPSLEGCQVVGISYRGGLRADITIVHHSLLPVRIGCDCPREHLELCAACGKALDANKSPYQVVTPSWKELMVCNEACAKKLSEPML